MNGSTASTRKTLTLALLLALVAAPLAVAGDHAGGNVALGGYCPVAYDGWCATGMAHGMKVESDPTVFVVQDGKTYLFSNEEAKAMFTGDAANVVAKADTNWSTVAQQGH